MTVLPIRITGDPVLHSPAQPVTEFDESLRTLVADMFETMDAAPGVGLAAPQVGVPLRLFVYGYAHDPAGPQRGVAINPELWVSPTTTDELDEDAHRRRLRPRPAWRSPRRRADGAWRPPGPGPQQPGRIAAEGWFARVLQHEFDHLDGRLYIDRLDLVQERRARKVIVSRKWGRTGLSWLPGVDDLEP